MKTSASLCSFALFAIVGACSAGCSKDEPASPSATPNDAGAIVDAPSSPPPTAPDFASLDEYLFKGSWVTEGVVVQHEGKIVFEKYTAGFDEKKRHITYSVSKSIGSALVGIAVNDGLIKLEDSICTYVPAPVGADPTYCDTKVDHVLRMMSGLKWEESYDDPAKSNVLPMLYGDESDMGLYVAKRPRAAKAGEKWLYSSGDSNLLALALKGALKSTGKDMRTWAKEKLFDPAGLSSAIFETDRSGTLVFSSSCFMSVRDMARFGQLYLDDGMNGATRVLPSTWVTFTHTPAPPVATPTPRIPGVADTGGSYGAAFWLNGASPTAPRETLSYPDAPADAYAAEGHWGQKIFIIPSRKLIVARVGNDRAPTFDSNPMLQRAVAAIDAAVSGGKK
jgi:CubicO group peptidase (beta-lactamase class C family)